MSTLLLLALALQGPIVQPPNIDGPYSLLPPPPPKPPGLYLDQQPNHTNPNVTFSDEKAYDPVWGSLQYLTDDFVVAAGERIVPTKLVWWGAHYKGTYMSGPELFKVQIRKDDGTGWPGQVEYLYAGTQPVGVKTGWSSGTFYSWDELRYEIDLPGMPQLDEGTYYIQIVNDTTLTTDGTWGWESAPDDPLTGKPGFVFSPDGGATWGPDGYSLKQGFACELYADTVEALTTDASTWSIQGGGVNTFSVDAGPNYAGKPYFLLGSASGSAPGFDNSGVHVPLNLDAYFLFTLTSPNQVPLSGSFGLLDGAGKATAFFTPPTGLSTSYVGVVLDHAVVTLDAATFAPTFASGAVTTTIVP